MSYDLPKIREACLELLGWKHPKPGHWITPNIKADCDDVDAPDPTISLDDALPLMEKFEMDTDFDAKAVDADTGERIPWTLCGRGLDGRAHWGYSWPTKELALAVCVCALECAGRDLKDFEVTP